MGSIRCLSVHAKVWRIFQEAKGQNGLRDLKILKIFQLRKDSMLGTGRWLNEEAKDRRHESLRVGQKAAPYRSQRGFAGYLMNSWRRQEAWRIDVAGVLAH